MDVTRCSWRRASCCMGGADLNTSATSPCVRGSSSPVRATATCAPGTAVSRSNLNRPRTTGRGHALVRVVCSGLLPTGQGLVTHPRPQAMEELRAPNRSQPLHASECPSAATSHRGGCDTFCRGDVDAADHLAW
jgi:hypothetical protein